MMRKSDGGGLAYRDGPENAQPPATEPAAETLFGDDRDDLLCRIMGRVISEVRYELRREWRREVVRLKNDLKVLRQQVDAETENGIEVYCSNVERRLATLEAENIKFKAMLESGRKRA